MNIDIDMLQYPSTKLRDSLQFIMFDCVQIF